jgi:hypothetical protein
MLDLGYCTDNPVELLLQQNMNLAQERFSYRLFELRLKIKAEINHLIRDNNSAARLRKNLYMASIRTLRRMIPAHA